ncbi:MAG: PEP-CTERM sorting domain-containing protein [Proteobacteria bacterium]|nr:PEP-CTERM sorting domain-containing protein [Pseudomonadota bacterium]
MRNFLRLMAVSGALWLGSNVGVATAGIFDGHTVNYQYYFPNLSSPYAAAGNGNYLVGSGTEISNVVDGLGTIDFSGNEFTVSFSHGGTFSPTAFNGFVISDLTANINPFTSFTLISNTGVSGTPTISFDSNHLFVNWEGFNYTRGDLVFSVDSVISSPFTPITHIFDTISPVPEPDTYALLLVGLGLVSFTVRRRQV